MATLDEQIQAVWEAQDYPATEAAEHRRTMSGLRPGTSLWRRYKLRADTADASVKALLAAHATLLALRPNE